MNGMQRHHELNGGAPPGWNSVWPIPKKVTRQPAATPTLYAIISTWFDGDIVAANVRNCFAQGATKVFILDNASPDDTVANAIAAGAEIAKVYETAKYDDDLRIHLQNEIIRTETENSGIRDLWWMVLDSDEFPTSLTGEPLIEAVRDLPPEIRILGCDFIDLYPFGPDAATQYEVGRHPAECMTHGVWRRGGIRKSHDNKWFCQCGHWKHTLIRILNGDRDIAHNRGNHTVTIPPEPGGMRGATISQARVVKHRIFEPDFEYITFHAPMRRREHMERRLSALCGTGRSEWDDQVIRGQGAMKRFRAMEHVYSNNWAAVEFPHSQVYGRDITGLCPYPWRTLLRDYPNVRTSHG
ncbi:MAG: hypothetical protein U0872_14250 [Planctomycetaceae bacterium]